MLALSIILLVIVAALVVASFVGGTDEVIVELGNVTITTSVGGVFVSGVLAGVLGLISLLALKISIQRMSQRTKEVQELRRRAGLAAPAGGRTTEPEGNAESRPRELTTDERTVADTTFDPGHRSAAERDSTPDDERP